MNCPNCQHINEDNASFCSVCGSSLTAQPQFTKPQFTQPQFTKPQFTQPQFTQPQYGQPQYGYPGMVNPEIEEFAKKAKTIKILGILAAVLMFGIGIIFSIVIWITKAPVPFASPGNPVEAQLIQQAIKDRELGKKLAGLPLIGLAIAFAVGFVGFVGGVVAYI